MDRSEGELPTGQGPGIRPAALGEDPLGQIGPEARSAVDVDLRAGGDLRQPSTELLVRDEKRAGDYPLGVLELAANIEQNRALGKSGPLLGVPERNIPTQQVSADEPGHVDRILRRAVRRGVREFEMLEVLDRHSGTDSDGEDVDALVDAVDPDGLRAEELAALSVEQHLEMHRMRSRVVRRMPVRMDMDLQVVAPDPLQRALCCTRHTGGQFEELDDAGALG